MSSVDLLEEFNKLQLDTYEEPEPENTDEILGGDSMKKSKSRSKSKSKSKSKPNPKTEKKKEKVEDGAESKIRFEAYDIKKRAPILTDRGNPITLTGGKKVYDAKEEKWIDKAQPATAAKKAAKILLGHKPGTIQVAVMKVSRGPRKGYIYVYDVKVKSKPFKPFDAIDKKTGKETKVSFKSDKMLVAEVTPIKIIDPNWNEMKVKPRQKKK